MSTDRKPRSAESVPGTGAAKAAWHKGLFRHSMAHCLVALALLLFTIPLTNELPTGTAIESVMMTVVLLLAVMAVGGRRRTLTWAILLVTPALAARWSNHVWPGVVPMHLAPSLGIVFIVFVVLHMLSYIFRARRVDSEVLCAGVAVYLLAGVVWGFAYRISAMLVPGSFALGGSPGQAMDGATALYFSLITLTTVGYGDITPTSAVARTLAMTEAMTGTLYMAVLISRLVALYSSQGPPQEDGEPAGKEENR